MSDRLLTAIRGLLQRRRVAREVDDELRFHIEMEVQSHVDRGCSVEEARRLALAEFGGLTSTREAITDVRATWIDSLWQDVRYGFRSLRRRPGLSVAASGMLALGVGLTTAMFTMVDALILRPVPFADSAQLASIFMGDDHGGRTTVEPAVVDAWRGSPAFAGAEAALSATSIVSIDGRLVTRGTARVTPGVFDLLGGVQPIRGRLLDPDAARRGEAQALISEDVWRSLYQSSPAIVGRPLVVDGDTLTIVGVLPADFRFPSWNTVIWRAADVRATAPPNVRRLTAYVRFAPGMPREDALRVATEAARTADAANATLRAISRPLAGMVSDAYYQRAAPLLAGGVVLVFLVLCANVSSLLLAGLTSRQREFGMRSALGASRARLMRQAFVESALIAVVGTVAGVVVAWGLLAASRGFVPESFLLRTLNPLDIDFRAAVVTSMAGVVATMAAGLLPAFVGTRSDSTESLRVVDRGGTESRGARAMTRALLAGEIALACTLLMGAAVLVRSFVNLAAADRGIDAAGVMTATLSLPATAYPDRATRTLAARAISEDVAALPGVQQVAWSYGVPPAGGAFSTGEWRSDVNRSGTRMAVERYGVGPEFFSLYGIPIVRGRTFTDSDGPSNVIVGERLARILWPGADPIGRTFTFLDQQFSVIGVAREINHPSLDPTVDLPEFYEPFAGVGSYAMMSLRCAGRCPDATTLRSRIMTMARGGEVYDVRSLEDRYFEQLARPRATAALSFLFAAVAMVAAAAGLFSVLTFAVNRRKREFGIRTALGASPAQVRAVVLRDGLRLAAVGCVLGALCAAALARTLASLEYGVTAGDPATWLVVLAVIATTTILASWRPARQAMRVDPVTLLREGS